MTGVGRDGSVRLEDGRVLEYWDGGDPAGRPVLSHPGTPVTRLLGRWAHDAAVAAGVRLVTINRPGYGGSTRVHGRPSLLGVGRDTIALARRLGMGGFAVVGASGGGPYAVATALASAGQAGAVGILGGVGPWPLINDPAEDLEDRACVALLDQGDVAAARACFYRTAEDDRTRSPEAFFDTLTSDDASAVVHDPRYRELWLANSRDILANQAGYIDDNIAFGGEWDVDLREVAAPTQLWYGTEDTRCSHDGHGRWYADRIPGAELIVLPGAAHFEIIDGRWPEVFAGLLKIWS